MILDTNAISYLLDGDKNLSRLLSTSDRHHLPLVVVAEYLYGLRSSRLGNRLRSLFRKLEADCEILYPDRRTVDWYVSVRFEVKQLGRPIPESDLWIAALALQHDLEIVSRDQHFDSIPKVCRRGW